MIGIEGQTWGVIDKLSGKTERNLVGDETTSTMINAYNTVLTFVEQRVYENVAMVGDGDSTWLGDLSQNEK